MIGINVHPSPAAARYFKVSKLVAWRFEGAIFAAGGERLVAQTMALIEE
jgi:hypothetical protein